MDRISELRDASSEERCHFIEEKLSLCLALLAWESNYEYNKWDASPRLQHLRNATECVVNAAGAMLEASKSAKAWKEMGRV